MSNSSTNPLVGGKKKVEFPGESSCEATRHRSDLRRNSRFRRDLNPDRRIQSPEC